LFDKNGTRQGSGEAIGSGFHSGIVPNLLLSSRLAPFSFAGPRGALEPALQNFHANEMAV
jgi:hypothetical protein